VQVSVLLRRRARQDLHDRVRGLARGDRSSGHVAREEFARHYGAEPADIAAVVRFLCGPDARFINGQTIHVNGGAYFG